MQWENLFAVGSACTLVATCWMGRHWRLKPTEGAAKQHTVWYPAAVMRPEPVPSLPLLTICEDACRPCSRFIGCTGKTKDQPCTGNFAVVILNTEENCSQLLSGSSSGRAGESATLWQLWQDAAVVVVADGAANHLFDSVEPHMRLSRLPHYIVGDLDSIRAEVREFYAANGVEILHRPSQDAHDFHKSLKVATEHMVRALRFAMCMYQANIYSTSH